MRPPARATERGVFAALAVLAVAVYVLYFVHLRADYPALLTAVDWARYTDEGWYGGAALHSIRDGHWYTPGGFNPAVALPLWPLLLRGWFALAGGVLGQGIVAARVLTVLLFGGTAVLLFALLRPLTGRVLTVAAVLLLLADPFSYGFDRLAILEPLVTFLLLLALWIARPRRAAASALRSVSVGLLLTALVLTKTTAVLLAPAVLFLLWHAAQGGTWPSSRAGEQAPLHAAANERGQHPLRAQVVVSIAAATACVTWLAYFFLLVRPHCRADFHHIFAVNAGHASGHTLPQALAHAVGDATWMGAVLWPLTLLLVLLSVRYLRELWRVPLFGSAVLALAVPIAFIGWHTWFIPHYYLPCVPPMLIALALALHALSRRAHAAAAPRAMRIAYTAAMLAVEFAFALMLAQTIAAVVHPRYTLAGAATEIAQQMRAGLPPGAPQPKLLAASADTFALFNGTASANPEWPIDGLPALVQQEQPGWYGGYLPYDAAHIAAMRRLRPLTEVARYTIQPTPDHAVFVLYRVGR